MKKSINIFLIGFFLFFGLIIFTHKVDAAITVTVTAKDSTSGAILTSVPYNTTRARIDWSSTGATRCAVTSPSLYSGSGGSGITGFFYTDLLATSTTFIVECNDNALPVVTTPTDSSVTGTSAILGANVTSLGIPASISARGICLTQSAPAIYNCVAQGGTTTGVFTQNVAGLSPNTTYYYSGYATNSFGTAYSTNKTFTTLALVNGVCNNSIINSCTSGTANDAVIADDVNYYKWRCDGSGGGTNSGTCQKEKTVFTVNSRAGGANMADPKNYFTYSICDGQSGPFTHSMATQTSTTPIGVGTQLYLFGTTVVSNTRAVLPAINYWWENNIYYGIRWFKTATSNTIWEVNPSTGIIINGTRSCP
jgi:hypothetical protein